jgi:cell division protein ZapA (FtsZ GTPase activity inhibitor)
MAEGKIKIDLSIAGRNYSMTIDAAKDELYREAANRLNAKVAEYSKVARFDLQDRLAMTALLYTITTMTSSRESSLGSEEIEELHAIERRIKNYIKE